MKIIRFTNIEALREEIFSSPLEDEYICVKLDDRDITFDHNYFHRLQEIASDVDSTLIYCCFRERLEDGSIVNHPVCDFQQGSLRNDFDFGAAVVFNKADVLAATEYLFEEEKNCIDGGWYALWLRATLGKAVVMVPEFLYTVDKVDYRKSGEKQHDYVDPRNKIYQKEMEEIFTSHLEYIDGDLPYDKETVNYDEVKFEVEASVIIPVRNRVRTIGDAVRSALSQKTDFPFNVIVVDNGSTDGTTDILDSIKDPRLVVLKPLPEENLGIGGCWNKAILDEHCGRFAVQLDSDDLYSSSDVLTRIVDKFRKGNYAMVIGSYVTTDFNGKVIPPGLVDHSEWTDENGANNALRINGFGAPRAFFTPVARKILFPNVSYGEDYAMCLRISRDFYVGRIYDALYHCRRWEGNSDAALSPEKIVEHNSYKDFIRSVEITARVKNNLKNSPYGTEPRSDFSKEFLEDEGYEDDIDLDDDDDSNF